MDKNSEASQNGKDPNIIYEPNKAQVLDPEVNDIEMKEISVAPEESRIESNVNTQNCNTLASNENTKLIPSTDISLTQQNKQCKEIADKDVMDQLDAIENIVIDEEIFREFNSNNIPNSSTEQSSTENITTTTSSSKETDSTVEDIIDDLTIVRSNENIDVEWYKQKLAEKEGIIKDRLSKLARVMESTYPSYKIWLDKVEKIDKSSVCKLLPTQRCPLDKPFSNRWKFLCSRQNEPDSTQENIDTTANKNFKSIWKVEAASAWGVNANNAVEFPSFVMHAVKVFEDFLQTTEDKVAPEDLMLKTQIIPINNKKTESSELLQQWLWLVIRSNRKDELMFFVTGRNISQKTMMNLKHVFEDGSGKECNVKSLYCKSVNKFDETTITNTTFLVGSEALDEVVGGIKVQLAPKTNFWSNASGAENVFKTVQKLLRPKKDIIILEVGSGIGLISLMLASKVKKVIGIDNQSEIEEAEITCELNDIKNASFLSGKPSDLPAKIRNNIPKEKTYAIINANTEIGRSIEIMMCLRQIQTITRVVMITTLTKQSVRAILELTRPKESNLGNAFLPIAAAVVDTLPLGPHFEAVILMERRDTLKFSKPSLLSAIGNTSRKRGRIHKRIVKNFIKPTWKKGDLHLNENICTIKKQSTFASAKFKKKVYSPENPHMSLKPFISQPNVPKSEVIDKNKQNWFETKPQIHINPLYEKNVDENKEIDLREKLSNNRINPDIVRKVKEHQAILEVAKEKLSGPSPTVDTTTAKHLQNMLNMVLEQTNKLQNQLPKSVWNRIAPLEKAEELPGSPKEEDSLFKGRFVQETSSMEIVITAENKSFTEVIDEKPAVKKYDNLQPLEPDTVAPVCRAVSPDYSIPVKPVGKKARQRLRRIKKRKQRIIIPNQAFTWMQEGSPPNRNLSPNRYSPTNEISPRENSPYRPTEEVEIDYSSQHRQSPLYARQMSPPKTQFLTRNQMSPPKLQLSTRSQISPPRRQFSPKHQVSPPRRQFSPRNQMSPPRRQFSPRNHMSPPRRQFSPRNQMSPPRRQFSPRNQMSPPRHQFSPRNQMSPPRHQFSPRNQMSPPRHQFSPRNQMSPPRMGLRHQISPPINNLHQGIIPPRMVSPPRHDITRSRQDIPQGRRTSSPMKYGLSQKRPVSPFRPHTVQDLRHQRFSPPRRQISPDIQMASPPRHEIMKQMRTMMYQDRISPMRISRSPQKTGPSVSPLRRPFSPERHQISPARKYDDDWDIPSRRAIEKDTFLNFPPGPSNMMLSSNNDRFNKYANQDNWDINSSRDQAWGSSSNDSWTNKQGVNKFSKESWDPKQRQDNSRWIGSSNSKNSENWNVRNQELQLKERWHESKKRRDNNCEENWDEDKEDWNELPEDARDPWGDEGSSGLSQERWQKFDSVPPFWRNEGEKSDKWQKPSQPLKPSVPVSNLNRNQWQSTNNQNEIRWKAPNETNKNISSMNWQTGGNLPTRSQDMNFPQPRSSFNVNTFKDRK